jgi:hypothetical protein
MQQRWIDAASEPVSDGCDEAPDDDKLRAAERDARQEL